jgi:hypothetical protein
MTTIMKQVICIKWGRLYGPEFVNCLYAMVARNISPPFRFVCFCDNPAGIREEVDTFPLPSLNFEVPKTVRGIWPKCRLWNAQLGDLRGPVLFLDLDLVVTGNLDDFFEFGDPDDVVLARNPSNPLERLGQTSVYRFPVGKLKPILDHFATAPQEIAEKYRFEQRYVTQMAPGGVQFWPRQWVRHFRRECRRPFPLNYFQPPRLPDNARIVIFPGGLHPSEAIKGIYYKGDPVRSPRQHILAGFKGKYHKGFLKHFRHYILPTPWVADHWRK